MNRSFVTCLFFIVGASACIVEDEKPSTPGTTTTSSTSAGSGGSSGSSSAGSGGGSVASSTSTGVGTAGTGTGGSAGGAADGGRDAGGCTKKPPSSDAGNGGMEPMLLSQTGLYSNIACDEFAPGVVAYEPQFALWSDTAAKRRWIKLPPNSKIDTSDMNFWQYPKDTKLFKEFTRDGVRVETRMIWKRDIADWFMMAYKWNAEQTEAVAVPMGEANASGTMHDIPSGEGCTTCHGSMQDRVLGFTAVQLSHNLGGLNLMQASSMGLFTDPPSGNFTVPGDAVEKAALGYLLANCGLCHNERSKVFSVKVQFSTWLDTAMLGTVAQTNTYTTLVNQKTTSSLSALTKRIDPGNPGGSAVHDLMSVRGDQMRQMPPTGTEMVDVAGLAAVDAWINKLPQDGGVRSDGGARAQDAGAGQ